MARPAKCPCGCGQAPAATTRMRKVECRWCGYTIRVSRAHMSRGLPVCPCGERMECRCVWDRAETGDEDAYAEVAAMASRSVRKPMLARRPQARCGACHKFVRSAKDECEHCGYHPTRGYADAMPF